MYSNIVEHKKTSIQDIADGTDVNRESVKYISHKNKPYKP